MKDLMKKHYHLFSIIGSVLYMMEVYFINNEGPINTLYFKIFTSVYALILFFIFIKQKRKKKLNCWNFYFRNANTINIHFGYIYQNKGS